MAEHTESTPQHSPQSVIDVAFVEGLQRDLAKNQAELARSLKQHREDRAQHKIRNRPFIFHRLGNRKTGVSEHPFYTAGIRLIFHFDKY